MAYPTITGFGPSANSAYTSALVEFSGTYGGCPSGLVGIPNSGTSGNSGIYDGSTYRHEITPTGGSIFFGFSGYTPSVVREQWEFNVNSITGGSPSCPTCAQVTSGDNFNTINDSVGYNFQVEYDLEYHAVSVSGGSSTGDIGTIVSQTIAAADAGGDPAGITNVCGWTYSSTNSISASNVGSWTYDYDAEDYGFWANNEYLGQHYIRLNDSNEWVFQVNPILEKGVPFISGVHSTDHLYLRLRMFSTNKNIPPLM